MQTLKFYKRSVTSELQNWREHRKDRGGAPDFATKKLG